MISIRRYHSAFALTFFVLADHTMGHNTEKGYDASLSPKKLRASVESSPNTTIPPIPQRTQPFLPNRISQHNHQDLSLTGPLHKLSPHQLPIRLASAHYLTHSLSKHMRAIQQLRLLTSFNSFKKYFKKKSSHQQHHGTPPTPCNAQMPAPRREGMHGREGS